MPLSLEQLAPSVISDGTEIPIEEKIAEKLDLENDIQRLKHSMEHLTTYEREILFQIYWNGQSQKQLAKIYGITQQTMNEKVIRILCKLLKFMEFEK